MKIFAAQGDEMSSFGVMRTGSPADSAGVGILRGLTKLSGAVATILFLAWAVVSVQGHSGAADRLFCAFVVAMAALIGLCEFRAIQGRRHIEVLLRQVWRG